MSGRPTGGLVSGTAILRGFPAGTTITGGLGTTSEQCVTSNNGRPFVTEAGSSLDVSIIASHEGFPSFCSARATQSTWRLDVSSPSQYQGRINFTLSQDAAGEPYHMDCLGATGGITCEKGTADRQIYVVANPSAPPKGALVTGTVTFRDFPAGTTIVGGTGTTSSECVTNNNGRPFEAAAGTSLDVTISVNTATFPSFCSTRASKSTWRLDVGSPAQFRGRVNFTLGQTAAGEPYLMNCLGSEGELQCKTGGEQRHIFVEPKDLPGRG
jgi:hypothetical protein